MAWWNVPLPGWNILRRNTSPDHSQNLGKYLLADSVEFPAGRVVKSRASFQGFNRIVAIALLFLQEEDAFWLLVYIVEHLMPPEYYSRDRQLIGCQVQYIQGDPSGRQLHLVDFYLVVPMSALICLGSCKSGRIGMPCRQHIGTPKSKST